MIRTCLEFLGEELNGYIKRKDPVNFGNKDVVIVSNLMTPDGQLAFTSSNDTDSSAIIISLINLEEDKVSDTQTYLYKLPNGTSQVKNPPIHLNLFLLFSVNATQYKTALRLLSYVVSFFQSNSVFESEKYPHLNALADASSPWQKLQRVLVTMHTITLEQQNNLWAALGAKYMPSIMYKARTITFIDVEPQQEAPLISDITISEN